MERVAAELDQQELSDVLWRYSRLAPEHDGNLIELAEYCLRPLLKQPEVILGAAEVLRTWRMPAVEVLGPYAGPVVVGQGTTQERGHDGGGRGS